jgi:hypothetical protein
VLCRNEDYVMRRLVWQGEVADKEWLRINLAIDGLAKQLAKGVGVHICRSENGLLGILALMRIVIAPGWHIGRLCQEGSRCAEKQKT